MKNCMGIVWGQKNNNNNNNNNNKNNNNNNNNNNLYLKRVTHYNGKDLPWHISLACFPVRCSQRSSLVVPNDSREKTSQKTKLVISY